MALPLCKLSEVALIDEVALNIIDTTPILFISAFAVVESW